MIFSMLQSHYYESQFMIFSDDGSWSVMHNINKKYTQPNRNAQTNNIG